MNNELTLQSFVQNTVLTKIGNHRELLVAYSGGIDSSVLLHALVKLKQTRLPELQISAIYIHHGISQNADLWAKHCQEQCEKWQVTYSIEYVKLALDKGNIEQQAREARYQAIAKHLSPQAALCTAQHLDDQSETFFLALKRGSGPKGLSAMGEVSYLDSNPLLRPLLTISRQQIEDYAHFYGMNWIEDESNQDDHYDRNFLRLNVLPVLNERWPHFNQMVARSAALCQEQQLLLNELLSESFNQLIDNNSNLLIEPLLTFSPPKRNALLRMWFQLHQSIMPSRKQLEMIWQTVIQAKEDSNPKFIFNGKQIRRYQNRLYLLPNYQDLQAIILTWDLLEPLVLPDNLGALECCSLKGNCRLPNKNEIVTVRFTAQGHFNVVGRTGSRQIKKLWQDFGIAPWMRTRIPLIFYNDTLITAVGVFITEQGKGENVGYFQQQTNSFTA